MPHFARTIPFPELKDLLSVAVGRGLVSETRGHDGLKVYCYTRQCSWSKSWNEVTKVARGLVLSDHRVVATPFPKFFNLLEVPEARLPGPAEPFVACEKLDGSLVVAFHFCGRWRAATKASFQSAQAQWAQAKLDATDTSRMRPGNTYLFEAVYPENRVVVPYENECLYLLGGYDEAGHELGWEELQHLAGWTPGFGLPERHTFEGVEDFERFRAKVSGLPADKEGYVIRYRDGTRVKLKGDEYRRIHKLIARVTPLGVWESMANGSDDEMSNLRAQLPPSFLQDFDAIRHGLTLQVAELAAVVASAHHATSHLTDKELGLRMNELVPAAARPFLFPVRKQQVHNPRFRRAVWQAVRPTGNVLPGYTPSARVQEVQDDPNNP